MASLVLLKVPRMGLGLKAFEIAFPRLLTNSLRQNYFSRTVSLRNITNFKNIPNNKKINTNCKYTGYRSLLFWPRPLVAVQTFSTVFMQKCFKHGEKLNCGRSQWQMCKRYVSKGTRQTESEERKTTVIYICAIGVFMVGASYAGVPLYRIFCQATGLGGQAVKGHDDTKVEKMTPVKERVISVKFNADVASSMQWNFKPQQTEVKVLPGETALAFYTAKNPTDKPIIGISTYNVIPFEAGQYFNKIQCFCFEEQRLNPHEQVDMPVFFFIDPEFAEDPKCAPIETITLSYTFFEAKEGLELPYPGYAGSMYAKSAS